MIRLLPLAMFSLLLALPGCTRGLRMSAFDPTFDIGFLNKRDFQKGDPERFYNDADFSRILENPSSYLGSNVQFRVMMDQTDEQSWESPYTSMSEQDYWAFSAWPAGVKLWTAEDWVRSTPTLYVNKTHPDFDSFLALERFSVLDVKGTVISNLSGKPWIQVHEVSVVQGPVYTAESLDGFLRGLTEIADRKNAAAIRSLETAVEGELPSEAVLEAHFRLGGLYADRARVSRNLDDYDLAISHYRAALRIDDHAEAEEALDRTREEMDKVSAILEREAESREEEEALEEEAAEEKK